MIGIGKGTQMLNTALDLSKTYLVKAKLGELTDTLDLTGTVTQQADVPTLINFSAWAAELMPEYTQAPPIYSNVKLNGQALHRIARAGSLDEETLNAVAKERSKICKILKFHVIETNPPFVTFLAEVSKGTYIRSLANDIAQRGKTVATVYELTRTAIGNISLNDAISLDKFTSRIAIERKIIEKTTLFSDQAPL
jgi:tRNA pseudouridine55 synthase